METLLPFIVGLTVRFSQSDISSVEGGRAREVVSREGSSSRTAEENDELSTVRFTHDRRQAPFAHSSDTLSLASDHSDTLVALASVEVRGPFDPACESRSRRYQRATKILSRTHRCASRGSHSSNRIARFGSRQHFSFSGHPFVFANDAPRCSLQLLERLPLPTARSARCTLSGSTARCGERIKSTTCWRRSR